MSYSQEACRRWIIVTIDIEELRKDLIEDCYGAYYGGGFGGALIESFELEKARPDKLIEIAQRRGIDLRKYTGGLDDETIDVR